MSDKYDVNRFEELLGQALEYALEHGISADYARRALADDWQILIDEKARRDRKTLWAAIT